MREHEHPDLRVTATDLLCGDAGRRRSLPGGMRMSTIRDVGRRSLDQAQQRLGVAAPPDDLEAGVLEHAGEAFAQQRLVVGDHEPHGISTRRGRRHLNAPVPPTAPTRSSDLHHGALIGSPAPIASRSMPSLLDGVDRHLAVGPSQRLERRRSTPPTPRRGEAPSWQRARDEPRLVLGRAPRGRPRSPSSASTAGNRPWATSRSATTASRTPAFGRPGEPRALVIGGCDLCVEQAGSPRATATSRCWAPSWRSRSSSRRRPRRPWPRCGPATRAAPRAGRGRPRADARARAPRLRGRHELGESAGSSSSPRRCTIAKPVLAR